MRWLKGIQDPIQTCFYALGTVNTIKLYRKNTEHVLGLAMKEVYEIDDKMSIFKEDSEISRFNYLATGVAQKVSKDTYFVIKEAVKYSKVTARAMDITIKPLVDLWRTHTEAFEIPDNDEIKEALKLVNINDLKLDDKEYSVMKKNEKQAIDLGSIAKGYAADQVRKILLNHHIKNAIINLGGNVIVMGNDPARKPWKVGVQNPDKEQGVSMGILTLRDKSVVTSGGYERYTVINNKKYHHILDPKTGFPPTSDIKSVTIVADNSINAEGLSTGIFVMGLIEAINVLKLNTSVDGVIITESNKVFITRGIIKKFALIDDSFTLEVI